MRVLREGSGDIAVFVPFTREWCIERFFDAFDASDVPFERCRLTVYVDHDDADMLSRIERRALATRCSEVVVHCSAWAPPKELALSRERRGRHSAMRTASVGLIPDATYLLLLEDDTLIPPDTWELLSAGLEAGYDWVSGFEVGRWGAPCPGIWDLSKRGIRRSKDPGDGLEDCDATGVYLVLTTPEVYRAVRWDVWDNAYGHDVSITWLLKKAGYRVGVEWRAECIHITETEDLTCDMWGPMQNVKPLSTFKPTLIDYPNVKPLTAFPAHGPKRGRFIHESDTEQKYRLGIDVVFDGKTYPKGSSVGHSLAVLMSEAGAIKARIT